LQEQTLVHWLTALRAPELGGQRLCKLLEDCGSIEAVCTASDRKLRAAGLAERAIDGLRQPDSRRLEADLEWLLGADRHLLPLDHEDYPPLLRQTPGPPPALWVTGDPAALWRPQIAIVGSRNPTSGGLQHGSEFAAELARRGFTIVSGLALGIDAAAHRGALQSSGGCTVAVMGTGPDRLYPARNADLGREIANRGALVTELPPGVGAKASHFPSRNRIISGLSLGVLVVEGGINSGSLITARLAAEQGREVFALPGSLHNPLAKGCHRLIKQGARLAEHADDIVQALGPMADRLARSLRRRLAAPPSAPDAARVRPEGDGPAWASLPRDPDYRRLWDALGHDPVSIDRLVTQTDLSAQTLSSMLLMLELRDLVETLPGGRVQRRGR
jgi:DNA processing protein